jgi:hypothetical protein
MSDGQRRYSDDEFARILRTATELTSRAEGASPSSGGLTLTDMKAAAAQVGLDSALVERAARMLVATANATPLERLTGGPVRHHRAVHFPKKLDEESAALLLSDVRVRAGQAGRRDVGHASVMGMTWHDGGDTEALRITARPEGDGTAVSLALDRRGTLGVVAMVSGIVMLLAVLFSVFALYPEAPALGFGGLIVGVGGVLAAARGYWASSTRRVRERLSVVADAIGQTLAQVETQASGFTAVGPGGSAQSRDARDGADTPQRDAQL